MVEIRISEDALEDLQDGFWFYVAQESGVGDYFLACQRADIDGLKFTGGIHRIVYQDYHRLLSRVFPSAVFYTFEENVAIVWAVIDCRRDPKWIEEHLNK